MESFLNKVAGCHLTKKDSTMVSFGWILWNSSDQLFSKIYAAKFYSSCCCFASVLTRNSILKNLFKSNRKMTVMGFFFQWFCRLCSNWRKVFNNSFFWVIFLWNISDQLFSETASGESLYRTSYQCSGRRFYQCSGRSHSNCANKFWTGPFGFIKIPEVRKRSNICRLQ